MGGNPSTGKNKTKKYIFYGKLLGHYYTGR